MELLYVHQLLLLSHDFVCADHSSMFPSISTQAVQQRRRRETAVEAVQVGALPMQTFFLPLPEASLFNDMFRVIQSDPTITKAPVESMMSVSISVDKTVIWYDHWEDGFEADVLVPNSTTTEVWGDGNALNGCAPNNLQCTDQSDFLKAGDSIVVQNKVEVPRDPTLIRYDGGDKLQASYPIAVTRGAFPKSPGSELAGGVEVMDIDEWGRNFEAPMGEDVGKLVAESAFEFVAMFFMAAYDNTTVTLPNGSRVTLSAGEGSMVRVNRGAKLKSDQIIQVDYIAGDVDSSYELRWFSLLDVAKWSSEYISPVGDTYASTKILLYNANAFDMVSVMDVPSCQSIKLLPSKTHTYTFPVHFGCLSQSLQQSCKDHRHLHGQKSTTHAVESSSDRVGSQD